MFGLFILIDTPGMVEEAFIIFWFHRLNFLVSCFKYSFTRFLRFPSFLIFSISIFALFTSLFVKITTVSKEEIYHKENISRDRSDVSNKHINPVKEFMYLKRRNWENHGTDVRINNDGMFVVTAKFLGESRKVREGILAPYDLESLIKSIENSNFFELKDKYEGPFKTSYRWWGYQLTVKTAQGSKTIRFHSEDETVPEILKKIVQKISVLTAPR